MRQAVYPIYRNEQSFLEIQVSDKKSETEINIAREEQCGILVPVLL